MKNHLIHFHEGPTRLRLPPLPPHDHGSAANQILAYDCCRGFDWYMREPAVFDHEEECKINLIISYLSLSLFKISVHVQIKSL